MTQAQTFRGLRPQIRWRVGGVDYIADNPDLWDAHAAGILVYYSADPQTTTTYLYYDSRAYTMMSAARPMRAIEVVGKSFDTLDLPGGTTIWLEAAPYLNTQPVSSTNPTLGYLLNQVGGYSTWVIYPDGRLGGREKGTSTARDILRGVAFVATAVAVGNLAGLGGMPAPQVPADVFVGPVASTPAITPATAVVTQAVPTITFPTVAEIGGAIKSGVSLVQTGAQAIVTTAGAVNVVRAAIDGQPNPGQPALVGPQPPASPANGPAENMVALLALGAVILGVFAK